MTSPTKTPFRSNAHTLRGISRIGLGAILRDNQLRGNHMLDLSRKGTSLFDGKDKPEQSRRDQLRRMQMVAIGIRHVARLDGFALCPDKQVAVRHGRTSQAVHPRVPVEAYRAASVDSDTQISPSVDNRGCA